MAQDTGRGASRSPRCRDDLKHAAAHKTLDAPDQNHSTRCARPPAGRNAKMRRSAPDRASVLPAKRAAASECDTTPLQNRHGRRISTLLVEKTGSNSGKSTIIGGCNAHSGDSQPMPFRKENQSNLVTWGNEKTVPASPPSVIPNGPNRTHRPPNIVNLPEFRGVFATTTRQIPQTRTHPPTIPAQWTARRNTPRSSSQPRATPPDKPPVTTTATHAVASPSDHAPNRSISQQPHAQRQKRSDAALETEKSRCNPSIATQLPPKPHLWQRNIDIVKISPPHQAAWLYLNETEQSKIANKIYTVRKGGAVTERASGGVSREALIN